MIDRIMKTCPLICWIIFLGFCNFLFAFQVNCSQLCFSYFLFLFLLGFRFFSCLLVLFCFLLNEFLNSSQFLLRSSHMMLWTFVRTLVRFLFIFFFIFFDSLLNQLNFLFFLLKIRLIRLKFSTLNSTFAMVGLMIPFITI